MNFDWLSHSIIPHYLTDSLQQTASILRMSVSMEAADLAAMIDDTEDLITLSGEEITEGGGDDEEDGPGGASSTSSLTSSNGTPPAELSSSPPPPPAVPPPADTATRPRPTPGANKTSSPPAPTQPAGFSPNDEQFASHEAILRLLEPGERLTARYRCARIFGLDVYEGLLLFGRAHFYVIDGYTLVNDRVMVDIDSLTTTTSEAGDTSYEPIVPRHTSGSTAILARSASTMGRAASTAGQVDLWSTGAVSQTLGKQYFKFPYENVQDVHKRRYLLQPTALEIFNADGRNFLMVFSKGMQNEVYHRLKDVVAVLASTGNGPGSTSSQPLLMSQKNTSNFLSSLMGEKTVTQRWMRGELSNFQYLMYLNTLAGRSYNDLMQYPIFPWILADYDSEELDLSLPDTFRDLSKPMGAQTENRLHQFQRRYREWEDPSGETPPYHYGTHYSSAMIVASYLLRMEPFTQQFLRLQGGHLDFPDRLFYSIKGAWLSASLHNMSDVRELIPEFFYLPDFLVNMNHFDLGTCQNGSKVDDVHLPPWAKGSPREFIRAHREALESEYVSAHLHEWIDLIFGCKQKGDAAVQADNVFHHLFYEGNVDIYSINDPLKRTAVIGFINNFGQIPKQLFRKPHPSRAVAVPRFSAIRFLTNVATTSSCVQANRRKLRSHLAMDLFYQNIDCLKPCLQPIKELKHVVGQIIQLDPASLPGGAGGGGAGTVSSAPAPFHLKPTPAELDAAFFPTVASPAAGSVGGAVGLALAAGGGTPTIPGGPVLAVEQNKCLLPPHFTNYIAWGFSDGSLRLCSLLDQQQPTGSGGGSSCAGGERARCVFEMVDRSDILCCAAPDKRTLVTAGITTVVRVWKISRCDPGTVHLTGDSIVLNVARDPDLTSSSSTGVSPGSPRLLLRATLCGHTDAVTCLAASATFNLIVSGSRDCSCILWDLNRLCYLRQLPQHSGPVAAVAINEATGDIATCATHWLSLWDCNGRPIGAVNTTVGGPGKQLLCVCPSTLYDWDAENVWLTGGSDGVVHMWGIEYMRISGPETTEEQNVNAPQLELDRYLRGTDTNSPENNLDWTCRLVARGQLTMHTAFARPDNQTPAAVTAIAVSRDHRSVLVGDARGRVHVWAVPASESARGGMTDQWVRDEDTVVCASEPCSARFSLTERRHHCRNCGMVFCSKCSRFESEIYRLRIFKSVRVCHTCHTLLKEIQAPRRRGVPHHSSSPNRTATPCSEQPVSSR